MKVWNLMIMLTNARLLRRQVWWLMIELSFTDIVDCQIHIRNFILHRRSMIITIHCLHISGTDRIIMVCVQIMINFKSNWRQGAQMSFIPSNWLWYSKCYFNTILTSNSSDQLFSLQIFCLQCTADGASMLQTEEVVKFVHCCGHTCWASSLDSSQNLDFSKCFWYDKHQCWF